MPEEPLHASLESARRLTVTKQHLTGKLPYRATREGILSVVRDLGYVQWDPVSIVAPSHLLSLWARAGDVRPSVLEELLWRDKTLFEHWTPMASLVLTEDYPLYLSLMRRYPESLSRSWGNHREQARRFLAQHVGLRRKVLADLKKGPRPIGQFDEHRRTKRNDGDWSSSSDVSLMLFHLLMSGDVMVVGREGNQNVWGLSRDFLPVWVNRNALDEEGAERAAAQRAIRALGTATPSEITYYFVRGRYDNLRRTLAQLENESAIHRVIVEGMGPRDERYVHHDDLPLLESIAGGRFEPRLSLVPPFDNLIYSPARTTRLFGFDYVREQFLPKEKRRYGTYVLPIVRGERIIGRVDPRLDKESGILRMNAVHAEPGAPMDRAVAEEVARSIARLATLVGARGVAYSSRVPAKWKSELSGRSTGLDAA